MASHAAGSRCAALRSARAVLWDSLGASTPDSQAARAARLSADPPNLRPERFVLRRATSRAGVDGFRKVAVDSTCLTLHARAGPRFWMFLENGQARIFPVSADPPRGYIRRL
jgi:hypothetical protein